VLLLLLLALCGCAGGPYTHGIQNLACVDLQANIWRGGQPDAQGWAFLSASGVSNVVKLNTGAELAPAGWCVTRCPITTWQQVFGPVGRQASNAMRAITPGTFIHCEHGVNRTGAAVMLYRVEHGWTKAAAQATALVKKGMDEGEAIAIANKTGDRAMKSGSLYRGK
jgi:hypothetical protein